MKTYPPKLCPVCQIEFTPTGHDRSCCSTAHYLRHWRKRTGVTKLHHTEKNPRKQGIEAALVKDPGRTLADIAAHHGVSRQYVCKVRGRMTPAPGNTRNIGERT